MRSRLFVMLAAVLLLAFAAGACGGKADPLVGDWKSQDTSVDMSFHVAAPDNGVYTVTWANASQSEASTPDPTTSTAPPVVTFQLKRKNDTVYYESDGQTSTFTLVGGSVVSVEYTSVDGSTQQRNFVKVK